MCRVLFLTPNQWISHLVPIKKYQPGNFTVTSHYVIMKECFACEYTERGYSECWGRIKGELTTPPYVSLAVRNEWQNHDSGGPSGKPNKYIYTFFFPSSSSWVVAPFYEMQKSCKHKLQSLMSCFLMFSAILLARKRFFTLRKNSLKANIIYAQISSLFTFILLLLLPFFLIKSRKRKKKALIKFCLEIHLASRRKPRTVCLSFYSISWLFELNIMFINIIFMWIERI